jgi:hypothetical protein
MKCAGTLLGSVSDVSSIEWLFVGLVLSSAGFMLLHVVQAWIAVRSDLKPSLRALAVIPGASSVILATHGRRALALASAALLIGYVVLAAVGFA